MNMHITTQQKPARSGMNLKSNSIYMHHAYTLSMHPIRQEPGYTGKAFTSLGLSKEAPASCQLLSD